MKTEHFRGEVLEDNAAIFFGQVVDLHGALITQSNITAIIYSVYDAGVVVDGHDGASLTVADVVYDTLQTSADDMHWPHSDEARGYNFRVIIPGSAWAEPDESRRVLFLFTQSDELQFKLKGTIQVDGELT